MGSATAPGTQIIQGAINISHLASSRTGVGGVRVFVFVPMLSRMSNSSGSYRVLGDRRLFYQDQNQSTAGGCWRSPESAYGERLGRSLILAGVGIRVLVVGGLFLGHQVFD